MPTVMVVDDEEDILQSTCMLLELLGYDAVPVRDPGEVLLEARNRRPGLILQDLRMPGLNVAGLIATLRSDPQTADVPIVFFSAHTDVAATASRYDVWGFLRKPFSPQALEQVLRQVFEHDTRVPQDPTRAIREAFHEQWNVLAALATYTEVLKTSPETAGDASVRSAASAVEDLLLRLEASTDRLHSFVSALASAESTRPPPDAGDDVDPRTRIGRAARRPARPGASQQTSSPGGPASPQAPGPARRRD